jgi:hypothetical protein
MSSKVYKLSDLAYVDENGKFIKFNSWSEAYDILGSRSKNIQAWLDFIEKNNFQMIESWSSTLNKYPKGPINLAKHLDIPIENIADKFIDEPFKASKKIVTKELVQAIIDNQFSPRLWSEVNSLIKNNPAVGGTTGFFRLMNGWINESISEIKIKSLLPEGWEIGYNSSENKLNSNGKRVISFLEVDKSSLKKDYNKLVKQQPIRNIGDTIENLTERKLQIENDLKLDNLGTNIKKSVIKELEVIDNKLNGNTPLDKAETKKEFEARKAERLKAITELEKQMSKFKISSESDFYIKTPKGEVFKVGVSVNNSNDKRTQFHISTNKESQLLLKNKNMEIIIDPAAGRYDVIYNDNGVLRTGSELKGVNVSKIPAYAEGASGDEGRSIRAGNNKEQCAYVSAAASMVKNSAGNPVVTPLTRSMNKEFVSDITGIIGK